jgi:hypothetical protein
LAGSPDRVTHALDLRGTMHDDLDLPITLVRGLRAPVGHQPRSFKALKILSYWCRARSPRAAGHPSARH